MKNKNIIVSTDLDGTLLDHNTYSWEPALPSINALSELNIPVVINTSKTFSEVEQLQKDIGLKAPFIVENGSAIYYPKDQFQSELIFPYNENFDYQVIGKTRSEVLRALKHLTEEFQYQFEGFNDWSTEQIIDRTGLNVEAAQQAQQREYSEPIIWSDSEARFDTFSDQLTSKNLRIIRGGRFIHILGQSNKGTALEALSSCLFGKDSSTFICLGDSYNDLDMLAIAEYPVFVRSPAHEFPQHSIENNNTIYTKGYGPTGWNESINALLNTL